MSGLDGFVLIFSLLTAQGHASLWLCMASRFLLHPVFSLKAVLSQLYVQQSANTALALPTSQSSTCQPAHPQNPAAVQHGGGRWKKGGEDKYKTEEKRKERLRKNGGGRNGLWSKDRKQFRAIRTEKKRQSAGDWKASSSNLHRIHHLRGQTLS